MKYITSIVILLMLASSAFGRGQPNTQVLIETVAALTGDTLATISMNKVSRDIGFFDGWLYLDASDGTGTDTSTVDSTYMGWTLVFVIPNADSISGVITMNNYQPIYIDTNTTARADYNWVKWEDIDLDARQWYRFLMYNPANPQPLPLVPVGSYPIFYFEAKDTDTLITRVAFPYEQLIE